MEFITALQTPQKIKHPTQRGFSLDKWDNHKNEFEFNGPQSTAALSFGMIVFKALDSLRESLDSLEKSKPISLNENTLKRYFVGLSNRNRKALWQITHDHLRSLAKEGSNEYLLNHLFDMPGAMIGPEGSGGNRLSLADSAHQLVDSIRLILGSLVSKRRNEIAVAQSETLAESEWLFYQEAISSAYDIVESYWYLVVYEEAFPLYDSVRNKIILNPVFSELNIAKIVSLTRMDNHRAATAGVTASYVARFKNEIMYRFPVEAYKKKGTKYKEVKINSLPSNFVGEYARALNEIHDIKDSISSEICEKIPNDFDFSLNDILNVFLQLRLFAIWKFEKFSSDTAFMNKGDISKFNLEIDRSKISIVISRCLNMSLDRVLNIINFFHYESIKDQDLWSNPLIEKNKTKSFVLIAPFMDAVITRNVEFWLRQLKIPLSEKGQGFESYVRDRIDKSISKSNLADISFQIPDQLIRISGQSEEIDSIIFIGNRALVMELKNIVSVDSPVSYGTASKRVKEGISQVKRKAKFIEDNIEEIVVRYGLDVDPKSVVVIPVVFVSNFIFAGSTIDGVPITDQLILEAFFRKNSIPILTKDLNDSLNHRVEVMIYESSSDASEKIELYLNNPPQFRVIKDSLYCSFQESAVEIFGDKKAVLRSIHASQSHDEIELLSTDFGFPILVND